MIKMQMPNCAHLNARGLFLSECRRPLVLELRHHPHVTLRIRALTRSGHKLTVVKFTPFQHGSLVRVQDCSMNYVGDGYILTPNRTCALIRKVGFSPRRFDWLRKQGRQPPRRDRRETITLNLGTRIDSRGRTWVALFATDVHDDLTEVRGLECWSSTRNLSRIFGSTRSSKRLKARRVP